MFDERNYLTGALLTSGLPIHPGTSGYSRGSCQQGWKKEFLESLSEAAKDIGEISQEEILRTVRTYRREKRAPQITVAAES